MPEAFKIADRIVREAVKREEKLGLEIPCTKGCTDCCRYLVRVSIPEALYIYERLLESEKPWRDKILERFQQAGETLKQAGLAEKLECDLVRQPGDVSYGHRLHLLSHQYLSLRLDCPFLDDEICSIYLWRPLACRQYFVTSPVRWCKNPFTNNVHRLSLALHVNDLLAQRTADALDEPYRMIVLPLALNWSSENQELAKLQCFSYLIGDYSP
ncbi:MAG: YkgJ family cysteine cluster protein [Desulfobacteraceae bacterium]|nr:MAG: YkgJ family cysteine cluster protein [Desulfobacteraceae bacterium]